MIWKLWPHISANCANRHSVDTNWSICQGNGTARLAIYLDDGELGRKSPYPVFTTRSCAFLLIGIRLFSVFLRAPLFGEAKSVTSTQEVFNVLTQSLPPRAIKAD